MPFNKDSKLFSCKEPIRHIGEARGDWKKSNLSYERVQGILVDTKWMMTRIVRQNPADVNQLAQLIERVIATTNPETA